MQWLNGRQDYPTTPLQQLFSAYKALTACAPGWTESLVTVITVFPRFLRLWGWRLDTIAENQTWLTDTNPGWELKAGQNRKETYVAEYQTDSSTDESRLPPLR